MFKIKLFRNTKGAVFITVMFLAALMIFVAVATANMMTQDTHLMRHLTRSTQALYVAEAGINDALAVLLNQGFSAKDNQANFPSKTFGLGTFDVTVTESEDRVLLTSVGTVQGVSRTVAVEVKDLYPSILEKALGTGGDMTIKAVQGNVVVLGNIHANGDMTLDEQGASSTFRVQAYQEFAGDATCSGSDCDIDEDVIVDGVQGANYPMLTLPEFNYSGFLQAAQAGGTYYGSSQNFNNVSLSGGTEGITFVDGDVTFSGNCAVTGGFVATGRISLNKGNSINQTQHAVTSYPIFISKTDMKLYGLFNTVGGNIVFAENEVKIQTPQDSASVVGNVISGGPVNIVANQDVTVTYFKVTSDDIFVDTGLLEIVSWNR